MRAEAGLAACVRGGDSRACDRDRDGARDRRHGAEACRLIGVSRILSISL